MVSFKLMARATNGIITRASKFARKNFEITDDIIKAGQKQKTSTFRDNELFREFKEVDEFTPTYGLDDLPLASSLNPKAQQYSSEVTRNVLDTDLITAKIIGTDRTVFLDTIYGTTSNPNEALIKYMNEGHSFFDCVNIFAKVGDYFNKAYLYDSFQLLKKGYPLEKVLGYMDEALMSGGKRYESGLLDFIANNPNKKHFVITKHNGFEAFDKNVANVFHILETKCKDDDEIKAIIKACRCFDPKGPAYAETRLLDTAINILDKKGGWSKDADELMADLKCYGSGSQIHKEYAVPYWITDKVNGMLESGKSLKTIIKAIKTE